MDTTGAALRINVFRNGEYPHGGRAIVLLRGYDTPFEEVRGRCAEELLRTPQQQNARVYTCQGGEIKDTAEVFHDDVLVLVADGGAFQVPHTTTSSTSKRRGGERRHEGGSGVLQRGAVMVRVIRERGDEETTGQQELLIPVPIPVPSTSAADGGASVADLVRHLQTEYRHLGDILTIIHGGRALRGDTKLSEILPHGPPEERTNTVLFALERPHELQIKTPSSRVIRLHMASTDTLAKVKAIMHERYGYRVSDQRLSVRGQGMPLLADSQTVRDIKNFATKQGDEESIVAVDGAILLQMHLELSFL